MSWWDSILGGATDMVSSAVDTSGDTGFNWGQLIKPALTAGMEIYSGIAAQDAAQAEQDAALSWEKEKFAQEMALAREKLAAGGGGGGGDPFAAQKMALMRRQQRAKELSDRVSLMQQGQQQNSEALRNLASFYQRAYD